MSVTCPLDKIHDLSNCQSWMKALHGGLLCLHNSKSKVGSSLTWNVCMLMAIAVNHSSVYFAQSSNYNITSSKLLVHAITL
jgi:hypothetical protein